MYTAHCGLREEPFRLQLLADRSLLAGYAAGARRVSGAQVDQAAREILAARGARKPRWRRLAFPRAKESS